MRLITFQCKNCYCTYYRTEYYKIHLLCLLQLLGVTPCVGCPYGLFGPGGPCGPKGPGGPGGPCGPCGPGEPGGPGGPCGPPAGHSGRNEYLLKIFIGYIFSKTVLVQILLPVVRVFLLDTVHICESFDAVAIGHVQLVWKADPQIVVLLLSGQDEIVDAFKPTLLILLFLT